jgi:hypothetical protein
VTLDRDTKVFRDRRVRALPHRSDVDVERQVASIQQMLIVVNDQPEFRNTEDEEERPTD